jgi:hypothetical protein
VVGPQTGLRHKPVPMVKPLVKRVRDQPGADFDEPVYQRRRDDDPNNAA